MNNKPVYPTHSYNGKCLHCNELCLIHERDDGSRKYVCTCSTSYIVRASRARPLPMNGTDSHEFGEC